MKKVIYILALATLILIINNLICSIWDIWQNKDIVSQAQKKLDLEQQENERLKNALSYAQTEDFIESQARDKLFMIKEGEKKVLALKEMDNIISQLQEKKDDPNWKKWWFLFFR